MPWKRASPSRIPAPAQLQCHRPGASQLGHHGGDPRHDHPRCDREGDRDRPPPSVRTSRYGDRRKRTARRAHRQWEALGLRIAASSPAVGKRYSGSYARPAPRPRSPRVKFWAIWNQPNDGVDLATQVIETSTDESRAAYRGLVDAAWSACSRPATLTTRSASARPHRAGLTTGNNPGEFSEPVPLRFIRALYCVGSDQAAARPGGGGPRLPHHGVLRPSGSRPRTRGCSTHRVCRPSLPPRGRSRPTSRRPPSPTMPTSRCWTTSSANCTRPARLTARAPSSRSQPPIEFGLQTNPPRDDLPCILRLLPTTSTGLSTSPRRNPRVSSYDQYLLTDPPGGNFATGLEYANGQPKPQLYDAYRLPLYLPVTRAHKGQSLELWGDVRPPRFARKDTGKAQQVKIQFQAGSKGPFKTLSTLTIANPHGYFDTQMTFPGSGVVQLDVDIPTGRRSTAGRCPLPLASRRGRRGRRRPPQLRALLRVVLSVRGAHRAAIVPPLRPRLTDRMSRICPRPAMLTRVLMLAVLICAIPAPAHATKAQESWLEDDVNLYANPAATLGQMRFLGVNRVRVAVRWQLIAPSPLSRRRPRHFNAADPAPTRRAPGTSGIRSSPTPRPTGSP